MTFADRDNCAFVLQRMAHGDRVRFLQDYYGVLYVELVPKWKFWRKTRVRLASEEFIELKAQIRADRPRASV